MKNQHIILLSLVLLTYPPFCLAGKKKGINAHRNNPTADELAYTDNQPTERNNGFEEITTDDAIPSVVTEAQKKEAQYAPGRYYEELNKWVFRNIRGLANETIAPFETNKGCDKALGTGDREENAFFFSEVLKSHINHRELNKAKRVSNFANRHRINLSTESLELARTFFENHAKALQQEHALLAPLVAKDKDVRAQQAAITAALERLKATNPEIKK